jgi:glycosyltransferase involved in cell wall biosynthesis
VPDRTLLAVYAGRLDADKSLEQLVLAWGRVHSRWPHARLWLAGDGAFRTVLQSQIKAMNMADHVKLIGVFDTVDVLLSAADLFVLPMTEGCPSVGLLEAMGAGLPIVAVNTRGNRDVLCDGSEGLLVAAGDVGAFCDGIVRLFEQSELASQLGAAARDRAMEEFSLAKMADDHVTWFEHLIEPLVDRSGCQCQEYR